jgi:DNA 3'-phosphatase
MRIFGACLVLAAAACSAEPGSDDDLGGGDGKGDSAYTVPSKRQTTSYLKCPTGDAKPKVAFFDADSTLRVSKSGGVTADTPTDVNVLPFAAHEIARLSSEGYVIAVVSNQGGIYAGKQTFADAEGALGFTVKQLERLGGRVQYFDFAENLDNFRKPETGMAELLNEKLETKCGEGIDFAASFMVGDSGYKKGEDGPHPDGRPADDFSNADRLFAENLGIPFHEPTDYFNWRDYGIYNIGTQADLESLLDAIDARAEELRTNGGDPDEIEALEKETAGNRAVNEI